MSPRTVRLLIRLALLLVPLGAGPSSGADPLGEALEAQVVLYLEAEAAFAGEFTVSIATVTLLGDAERLDLECEETTFGSRELAGRQLRLVDAAVRAGTYRAIEFSVVRVEAKLGKASIQLAKPAEGISISIPIELRVGQCRLVRLFWSSQEVDPDQEFRPAWQPIPDTDPPPGSLAFVSNEGSSNLSVVDRYSWKVVDAILTGSGPRGLSYSRDGGRLYVACSGSDRVDTIDLSTRERIGSTQLRFGDEPSRLLLSTDERELYVLNYGSNSLSVVDTGSQQEVTRVLVGIGSRGMTLEAESGRVYVASQPADRIGLYDPETGAEIEAITTVSSPSEILYDPDSRQLYVASAQQSQVVIIDRASRTIARRFPLCSPANGLAFQAGMGRLFSVEERCREVAVFLPESDIEIGRFRLDGTPGLPTLDADSRRLLIPIPNEGKIVVYNAGTRRRVGEAVVGERPHSILLPE